MPFLAAQAAPMRAILVALLVSASHPIRAEEPVRRQADAMRTLQAEGLPGTEPVLADTGFDGAALRPYAAALVERPAGVMRLVLVRHRGSGPPAVVARSAPIGGLRSAQLGFGIESFRFNAADRLKLSLSARSSCTRALYTHRFAVRQGQWLVTGLDVEWPRCAPGGIGLGGRESANFLNGTVHRTTFDGAGESPRIAEPGARRPFPVAAFPPTGPEGAYRKMKP